MDGWKVPKTVNITHRYGRNSGDLGLQKDWGQQEKEIYTLIEKKLYFNKKKKAKKKKKRIQALPALQLSLDQCIKLYINKAFNSVYGELGGGSTSLFK